MTKSVVYRFLFLKEVCIFSTNVVTSMNKVQKSWDFFGLFCASQTWDENIFRSIGSYKINLIFKPFMDR